VEHPGKILKNCLFASRTNSKFICYSPAYDGFPEQQTEEVIYTDHKMAEEIDEQLSRKVFRRGLFQCPECLIFYKNLKAYQDHLKKHETAELLKETKQKTIKVETARKPVSAEFVFCSICNFNCKNEDTLAQHQRRMHENTTDNRPFRCNVCGRRFKVLKSLESHLKTHTDPHQERPFVCDICDCTYADQKTFKLHTMIHINERFFRCSVCPKRFNTPQTKVQHEKLVHSAKKLVCAVCQKTYSLSSKKGFMKHLQKHEESPLKS
jgi:KRAB domain-containing zinc finger protein